MQAQWNTRAKPGRPLILPFSTPLGNYFYDTNRNEIVYVSKDLYQYINAVVKGDSNTIQNASPNIVEHYTDLTDAGYLSARRTSEVQHPSAEALDLLLGRRIEIMTLQATQSCNLRCGYCIYSGNGSYNQRGHSDHVMSFDIAKKAIDFYFKRSIDVERPTIGFYGGEPLLKMDLIKLCVAYAREVFEGRRLGFSITTNATLLTNEALDFLVANEFKLMISLDGPKTIHDKNRRFAVGDKGSYDIVTKKIGDMIRRYPAYSKTVTVNMVIDPQNDYAEINSMFEDENISMLKSQHSIVESPDEDDIVFSQAYNKASVYNRFLQLLHLGGRISVESLSRLSQDELDGIRQSLSKIKYAALGSVAAPGGPCVPGKMRLFTDFSGKLYPCERVSESSDCMCIGSLDGGFDMSHVDAVLNVGKLTAGECRNCWAFIHCNICAKKADDGGKLSADKKLRACRGSRESAFLKIMNKVALFEIRKYLTT